MNKMNESNNVFKVSLYLPYLNEKTFKPRKDEMQLFCDLLIVTIISSIIVARMKS